MSILFTLTVSLPGLRVPNRNKPLYSPNKVAYRKVFTAACNLEAASVFINREINSSVLLGQEQLNKLGRLIS